MLLAELGEEIVDAECRSSARSDGHADDVCSVGDHLLVLDTYNQEHDDVRTGFELLTFFHSGIESITVMACWLTWRN